MGEGADLTGSAEPGLEEGEAIPLSALQHAVYCLRQAALIHLERLWADNRFTAEGHVLHAVADKPGTRHGRGVRRVSALPLASRALNIAGVADLVEFHKAPSGEGAGGEVPYPVEFKRGKAKLHRADEVQLCAQALCLEEMTGKHVPAGALYYAEPKRRLEVPFDAELRALTLATIAELATIFATRRTPPPVYRADRCRACSLAELCRPKQVARPVLAWRARQIRDLLESEEGG